MMADLTAPDRQLAELWAISENMSAWIKERFAQLHDEVQTWEPRPYPMEKP